MTLQVTSLFSGEYDAAIGSSYFQGAICTPCILPFALPAGSVLGADKAEL